MNYNQFMKSNLNVSRQIKIGVIISYLLIVVDSLYGFFIFPFILGQLGNASYGVYKTVSSFSATLSVVDLGIGATVLRFMAKFRAEGDKKSINNYMAMSLIQGVLIDLIIVFGAVGMFFLIDPTYSSTFNGDQMVLAKELFVVIIVTMCSSIFENILFSAICSQNHFIFPNLLKLASLVVKICAILVLLKFWPNALALTFITLAISLIDILIEALYLRFSLGIKCHLSCWDNKMFKDTFKYGILLFVQSIVSQINSNLDNVVIGAIVSPEAVTVYSFGLSLENMFEHFGTSFSNVMLPSVSEQIHKNATSSELEDTVIKIGRFQFIILGAALCGFIVIGKDFITLWLGHGFDDVYIISIILMIPAFLELIVNVCLSIIRAENKNVFRTICLSCGALLNLIITIIGVRLFGYIAAAVGTAVCLLLANLIGMNIYYKKRIGLNMFRIYKGIFKRTWACLAMASTAIFVSSRLLYGSWLSFCINVAIFFVVYVSSLMLFGLNEDEKRVFCFWKKRNKTV